MFALVDCNNFYASCERLFRPELRRTPLVVLSNNDGCIIARSKEAKALGIPMGQPYHLAKPALRRHGVAVFSSNYPLYGDLSRRVMETLERFSPSVEIYSIDEAFVDLFGFKDPLAQAQRMQASVPRWTGLPISIGLGSTKTLAKIANYWAKKSGDDLFLLSSETAEATLRRTDIGTVWGIGRNWRDLLIKEGIATAWDFAQADTAWVLKRLSVTAVRTQRELQGVPCIPFSPEPDMRKGLMVSETFGKRIATLEELRQPILAFTARASRKLRDHRLLARRLWVYARTNMFDASAPFHGNATSVTLPLPTQDSFELGQYAMAALQAIFEPGHAYHKAGVFFSELIAEEEAPRDLVDSRDRARSQHLMDAIDRVQRRHGRRALKVAGAGVNPRWQPVARFLSPRYTTHLAELPVVKA